MLKRTFLASRVACRILVPRSNPGSRCGFTVLELLTVAGVMSILIAIVLPAIGTAREAARRMQCVNHLKQIGIALHNYHEVFASFPTGIQWEETHQSAYGWAVPLLPFLEQRSVYEQTCRNSILMDPRNDRSRYTSIGLYLCPSDITEPAFLLSSENRATGDSSPLFELPTASYIGVFGVHEPDEHDPSCPSEGEGTFLVSRSIRLADLQRGASNTIIIGERTMSRVPATWLGVDRLGADSECRLLGSAITSPNCHDCDECEFDSRHPGGSNFLWADGHVRLVSEDIDSKEYQRMSRRTGD